MNMRRLLSLLPFTVVVMMSACGGSRSLDSQVQQQQQQSPPPAELAALLPALADIDTLPSQAITRGSSDIQGNAAGWTPNIYGEGNFSQDGNSLVIDTETGTRVGALYRLVFPDGDIYEKQIPYLYPYDLTINTDGNGPVYVLLPDYGRNRFDVFDNTTQTGTSITIPGGMLGNHGNAGGSIVFGIVAWNGSDLRIDSIDMLLPDIPAAGQPVDYHEFIEAADGTLLATDIYLPYKENSPFIPDPPYPAVLIRTPYSKDLVDGSIIKPLTDNNVTVLVQYFRGRLSDSGDWPDSGGTESIFTDHAGPDHTDALDTVDWLDDRHWFSGKLVASGPSALGLWIYQAAPELGDRLTGMYPIVSSGNVADWAMFENGALKQGNLEIYLNNNGYPPALLTEVIDNFSDAEWRAKYDFDSRASEVTAPGFHETGWFDVDVDSTIHSWQALQHNGGSGAAGNQWLIIGPWSHDSVRMGSTGELTFPTSNFHDPSVLPMYSNSYTWDGIKWAAGLFVPSPFPSPFPPPDKPVLAYFIGEEGNDSNPHNTWYELDDWPPAPALNLELFLNSNAKLEQTLEPLDFAFDFKLDPSNPIATIGGANLPGTGGPTEQLAGPYDQSSLQPNDDIREYRSASSLNDVCIAGPIVANLYVNTDAVDTDIVVKLIDRYPNDGPMMLVADSIMRLSYAEPGDHSGGETVHLNWVIANRAYVFGIDHQIVIQIQSSNYPRFNPNPGDGSDYYVDGVSPVVVQTNNILMGTTTPSSIILPVYNPPDIS